MHARELFDEIVMNKAFTKESDDADDDDPQLPALPSGGKNYITPQGYARIRAELLGLIDNERHGGDRGSQRSVSGAGPQLIYWVILARCALSTDGVLLRLRSAASS